MKLYRTLGILGALLAVPGLIAADWPMYRADPERSATTRERLADKLYLQWTWHLPPRLPLFHPDKRNCVDGIAVPVIAQGVVLIGHERSHALEAYDLASGKLRWRYVAEAPFRFAPAVADGIAFAAADDGILHALDLATGAERWRYVGAPSPRKIVNHGHLTSAWPTSGGPMVADGIVYFSTGIMPLDGTWVHAVDASTGRRRWQSMGDVTWGYAARIGDLLSLPSGMSPSLFALADGIRRPGNLYDINNFPPNRVIGWQGRYLFNGKDIYGVGPEDRSAMLFKNAYINSEHQENQWMPVIDGDRAYGFNDGILRQVRLPKDAEPKGKLVPVGGLWYYNARPAYKWSQVGEMVPKSAGSGLPGAWYPRRLELKAGDVLVAGGPGAVVGIKIPPADDGQPMATFALAVEGHRQELAVADGRLVVACDTGTVFCFGPEQVSNPADFRSPDVPALSPAAVSRAEGILSAGGPGTREGFAVVVGDAEGQLSEALAAAPPAVAPAAETLTHRFGYRALPMPSGKLQVVTLVGDRIRAAALRQRLAATGHDAAHLTALDADPVLAGLPPYFANVMVITASAAQRASADPAEIGALFSSLRPYGGTACFELDETGHRQLEDKVKLLGLPHAEVRRSGIHSLLVRVGALPDSDNWTHERHSPANSLCSTDTAIKAPMGMLWMGGVASENHRMYTEFLPPAVQVLEGRYIVQGHGIISAIDVYTGRLLWEIAIPKAQYFGAYLDSIKDASGKEIYPPADQPSWEGNHAYFIPGEIELARICGNTFTMVSLNDGIYLAIAEELWVLSPVNGKIMRKMPMPFQDPASGRSLCWGGLRVMGDTLVATAFDPARWKELWPVWKKGNERNKQRLPASWLFAADRSTGELRWKRRAGQGYQSWGVAAGRGRVYAVDSMIPEVLEGLANPGARAGAVAVAELPVIRPETPPTVVGLDLASGRQLWSAPADPLVLDIAYSEKHDLLVLPSRQNYYWKDSTWALVPSGSATAAKISAKRESSVMRALRGSDGTEAWRATNSEFAEPVVINDQVIFTRLGQGFDLSTGTPALRDNAVTGAPEPVTVSTGGCNFLIGSPGFVTHRTCYDEWSVGSTVPFDGIRSGCTPSMIPANGVVSIFNQAMEENTQFRAGGALVHRSDMVNWATLGKGTQRAPVPPLQMVQALGKSVVRLGLDFGAPDDHVEANGRAWVAVLPDPTATAVGKKNPNKSQPLVRFPGEGVTTFILPAPGLPAAQGGLPTIAATGCEGVSECSIRLVPDGQPARRYTVRLHFLEPNERARPGERVFSVAIQGKTVVAEIDLAKEPGPNRACVWTMSGIEVTGELGIALTAKTGRTVLCGMEVEAEQVP